MKRGDEVAIEVDGRPYVAYRGETVATALHAAGLRRLRSAPVSGAGRGIFCFIGVCQECVITVDARRVQACMEPVRDGMVVTLGS
ncbi:MAG: (2Fe-2S)-binding protein [Gammaproteobacteria bacterium]